MEIIEQVFALPVLPFTLLLILVFLYWIMVIVGAITPDALHLDSDVGADIHADVHADVHADAHVDGDFDAHAEGDAPADLATGGSTLAHVLHFFNVGEVPLMVVLSFFLFTLWSTSLLSNYYLGGTLGAFATVVMLVPNVIASLLVAKVVTWPFKQMFKHISSGVEPPTKIVGKTCIIKTPEADERSGQGELRTQSSPLLLNVRTRPGERLHKGEEALVVSHDPQTDVYTVVRFDLES